MNAPCKGCTERSVLCHSTCPAYLRFVKDTQRRMKQRQADYLGKPAFVRKIDSPYRI